MHLNKMKKIEQVNRRFTIKLKSTIERIETVNEKRIDINGMNEDGNTTNLCRMLPSSRDEGVRVEHASHPVPCPADRFCCAKHRFISI